MNCMKTSTLFYCPSFTCRSYKQIDPHLHLISKVLLDSLSHHAWHVRNITIHTSIRICPMRWVPMRWLSDYYQLLIIFHKWVVFSLWFFDLQFYLSGHISLLWKFFQIFVSDGSFLFFLSFHSLSIQISTRKDLTIFLLYIFHICFWLFLCSLPNLFYIKKITI